MTADTNVVSFHSYFEPVRKSITVGCSPQKAFETFTTRIHTWWPLATHSLSQARAATCVMDPQSGGDFYEIRDDGERVQWGHVLVWEPPHRVVLAWHPGSPPEQAQEVEVRFSPAADGTRVDLEHRNWHKLGERAADMREAYDGGWETVFGELFARACNAREEER